MVDINLFDHVFRDVGALGPSYSAARLKAIKHNRNKLHGLFFDRVCDQLNAFSVHDAYPPKDERELRGLHRAIVDTEPGAATQPKAALLYYILLDLQDAGNVAVSGRGGTRGEQGEEAERFAAKVGLGTGYKTAMTGFWEMDRLEFRSALDHLTQPSLMPTLSTDVLEALLAHSKEQTLPLAYYQAVSPPLPLGSKLRQAFYQYLTEISPVQAFYASRGEPDRRVLFELMIRVVLKGKPDEDRADMAVLLIDLPFDETEEAWWEDYLTGQEGRGLPNAMDALHMRHIATGRVGKAAASLGVEGRLRSKKIDGVDWDVIRDGVAKGIGGRKGLETL